MPTTRCAPLLALGTVAVLLGACSSSSTPISARPVLTTPASASAASSAQTRAPAPAPLAGQVQVFGHSVEGRPLVALTYGAAHATRRVLVVGVIHGNESAGQSFVNRLLGESLRTATELVVVSDLNPDGVAHGTRQNARGVDLNRNFPYRWQPGGHRGDQQYPGTAPLSEPESRAMATLIRRLRPTVSVWFHQPVGVVDESGGSTAVEARFSAIIGLPLRTLVRYRGSVASWENTTYPGTTAFVVELPRHVGAALQSRAVRALRDLVT